MFSNSPKMIFVLLWLPLPCPCVTPAPPHILCTIHPLLPNCLASPPPIISVNAYPPSSHFLAFMSPFSHFHSFHIFYHSTIHNSSSPISFSFTPGLPLQSSLTVLAVLCKGLPVSSTEQNTQPLPWKLQQTDSQTAAVSVSGLRCEKTRHIKCVK